MRAWLLPSGLVGRYLSIMTTPETPGVHLSALDGGRLLLQVRSAARLAPSLQPIAWVIVVAGVLGLGGLAALRVPWTVDATFVVFVAGAAAIVYWDAQRAGVKLDGELIVDTTARRLERRAGLEALAWDRLDVPALGAVVVDLAGQKLDTRVLLGRTGERCRVSLVGADDLDHAWVNAASLPRLEVLSPIPYDLARAWAEGLSRALGWPIFDLASAHPERREAGEIERSMADHRHHLASTLPEVRGHRRPWGAAVWRTENGMYLGIRTGSLAQLMVDAALGVPLLIALFLLSGGNAGIVLFGVLLFLLAIGGRTRLQLTPDRMIVHTVNLWLPLGGEISLWWTDIEQVQVVMERGLVGLRISTNKGSTFVPTSSRAAARWGAAQIRRYLLDRSSGLPDFG